MRVANGVALLFISMTLFSAGCIARSAPPPPSPTAAPSTPALAVHGTVETGTIAAPARTPASTEGGTIATAPLDRRVNREPLPTAAAALEHCTSIEAHPTGWITASCAGHILTIQAGYAGKDKESYGFSLAQDMVRETYPFTTVYPAKTRLAIGGGEHAGYEFSARVGKEGFFGGRDPDPQGEVRARGIHARLSVPRGGSIGVSCFAPTPEFDHRVCEGLMTDLLTSGLPTRTTPPMQVVVAGTRLDLSGNCWSSRPRDIYCFGKGGMEWQHGERASLVAARDQEIGSMRGPNTHLEDGRELRLDIRTTTCGAAARGGECTTAAFFGVADQPALIRHFAIVQDKGRHILVKCTTTIDLKVPPPCRQFFGLPQTMTASLFR